MDKVVIWVTIAVYIVALVIIGIVSGRKSKSIADFTVGGRNAGAWLSALSYGTAYFSAVMFVGYAGKTGLSFGLWGVLAGVIFEFAALVIHRFQSLFGAQDLPAAQTGAVRAVGTGTFYFLAKQHNGILQRFVLVLYTKYLEKLPLF